ncbi:MAG TPA: hypothetical protein ENI97_03040 [Gammaproteobacteria bacterium]|nr:hypothetical protein [Gammaproteobacteria bacterium]
MQRVGQIAIWLGILLTLAGLLLGFGVMLSDRASQAVNLLALVPIGFMLLMLGTVMTQLSQPDRPDRKMP